jgi:putative restriction endonuclease
MKLKIDIKTYIRHFTHLTRAPGPVWTDSTRKRAPHKPILLLAVLDLVARGVITSRQISANPNVPGFLLTLSGRGIIPPADRDHWPAQQYLAEHRREWRLG